MTHRISPATVIASVALFFSLTGAGMAATGYRITSLWQIAPKVRHALRGERGPQGPTGPAAPTPSFGAGSEYTIYKSVKLVDAATVYAAVRCSTPGKLVSGGVSGANDVVSESLPQGSDGWLVSGHLDPADTGGQIVAWAACAN